MMQRKRRKTVTDMNYQIIHSKRLTDDHETITCTGCGKLIGYKKRYYVIEKREGSRITNTAFCGKCYELLKGEQTDDR